MGCITSIAIALWLMAFAAGTLLLYKVQKENLQWPFRVAGWFIIIIALGGMLCCSLRCVNGHCDTNSCNRPPMMTPYHFPHGHQWKTEHCHEEKTCACHSCTCNEDADCCEEEEEESDVIIKIDTTENE